MLNKHSPKMEQSPTCIFPTTKLKNISCVFCRHQFYIRDLGYLKGKHLPLLLNCGHAVCQNCATYHIGDPCPLCKATVVFNNSKAEKLLPVNIYVVGLFGVAGTRPVHREEPDIAFPQSMAAKMKQRSIQQGYCFQCGWQAVLKCLQCNELLCHTCSSKIHSKLKSEGQNEGHFRVMLTDYSKDPMFESKRCHLHDAIFDYYCEDCDISGCPHCMLEFHKVHNTMRQSVKNEEYMEDFHKAHEKLAETRQRIRQAQKKLKKALLFPDEVQNSETIEAAINQHFTHLHGVLQNVERALIDKLYEHRNYTTNNLNDIQLQLKIQEEQVQAGLLMVAAVNDLSSRVSLKDVIAKLESLANVPCHLVEDPIAVQEKIMFSRESSIIEMLENHCKLSLPEVAGFNLLTKDALPTDYKLEPLVVEDLTKSETFSLETSLIRSSSCQSLASSRRSETPLLKQSGYNLVHVCYVENPSKFYVRLACHRQLVGEMEAQLTESLEKRSRPPQVVQQNKIYAVKRSGNRWCRGRINAITTSQGSADTYEVFHLDFGRTEKNVPKSRLRCIPDEVATIPQTAINCALSDIVPKDGIWRSDARRWMTDFFRLKEGRPIAMYMYIIRTSENTHFVDICKEPARDVEGRHISARDTLIFEGYGTFATSHQLLRSNPQSVRRFFREDFNLNTYYDVKCSHVESPSCVFVQKAGDNLVYLAGLINEMSAVYNNIVKTPKLMIHVPEIGMPCAIEKVAGLWCRGIVLDVPAPQTVQVFLLDFGSKITTNHETIRKLHEKFMAGPGQAIKVTLADIEPLNDVQWSKQAINFTKDYIGEDYARVVAFEKSDFGYNVALYINEVTNFAALLVNSSFAVSTGPRSSGLADAPNNVTSPKNQKPKVRNSRTCKTRKPKRNFCDIAANGFAVESATETTEHVDPYRVQITIIRAESPDIIYVADPAHEKKYQEMMDQMQKFYNKYREISDKSEWKVDYLCVVYSAHDRLFCRGKITAINAPDEVEVFLCDLAFTVKVPINELQALKKKFWKTQTYAFKVKLAGISPCGGSSVWPSASCTRLKDIILENQRSKFYISKVINPDESSLYVELWVEQAKIEGPLSPAVIEVNSINWMLVDAGLALPIKQYSEKTKVLGIELMKQISNTEKVQRDESYKLIEYGKLIESDGETISTNSNSSKNSVALSERTLVSNEEVPTSWLPAEEIIDDTFIAKPSYVDNDCCVYLHSVTQNESMLHSIENTLENIYSKMKAKSCDFVWQIGDLCIAQYHSNKKWYRGQVVGVNNAEITVEFIDYGNVETCELGTLRKRLAMTHIPRQSTKCVIYGLYPNTPTHKWRTHNLDTIHSLLVDKECEVTVKKRKADHLKVEITMLNPTRQEFMKYIVKELRMDVRVDYSEDDYSGTEVEITLDESDDVIIDGYFNSKQLIEDSLDLPHEEKKKKQDSLSAKAIKSQKEDSVDVKIIEQSEEDFVEEKIMEQSEEDFVEDKIIVNKKEDFVEVKMMKNKEEGSDDDKSIKEPEENVAIEKIVVENEENDSNGKFANEEKDDDVEAEQDIEDYSVDVKNALKDFNDNLNTNDIEIVANGDLDIENIKEEDKLENIEISENNNSNESQVYEADYENNDENGSTMIAEHPTVVTVSQLRKMNFSIHYDDFAANDTANLNYYDRNDVVLSGTQNFTRGTAEIDLSQEEAMGKLETISLPDSYCIKEDELVASTPLNDSMECGLLSLYKLIVFPPGVKVVKAEVAVVGPDVSWLHLLDNGNSKDVTKHRQKYESIVADMQKHAVDQPRLLKIFDADTPCCVKYTDGLWYRCSIIDHDLTTQAFDDVVRVCFVDWGNFADMKFDELRSMKEEWLEAPCLSLPCRLWGVEKSTTAAADVFMKKLWEAYGGNVTLSKAVYVEIKNFRNEIYDVQIYSNEDCTQLVYDSLIKEGLFIQTTKQKSD